MHSYPLCKASTSCNDENQGEAGILPSVEQGNKDFQLLITTCLGFFMFELGQNCLEVPGEHPSSTTHLKDLHPSPKYCHCLTESPKVN